MAENGVRYVTMPLFLGMGTLVLMLFGLAFSIVFASNSTANEAKSDGQTLITAVGVLQNDVKWIIQLMEEEPNSALLLKARANGKNPIK